MATERSEKKKTQSLRGAAVDPDRPMRDLSVAALFAGYALVFFLAPLPELGNHSRALPLLARLRCSSTRLSASGLAIPRSSRSSTVFAWHFPRR